MVKRWMAGGTATAALLFGTTVAARQVRPAPAPAARPAPAPRMPIPVAALLPGTQALFDGYVKAGTVPGMVGAFATGEGPTLFVAAGRIADAPAAAPAGPDSLWRVYSMTKPITAMAAMMLIEDGKLKLDEPLSTYLPAFARMRVLTDPEHTLDSRPATRPITIRNLLTHTAGLGYTIVNKGPIQQAYEHAGILPFAADARTEAKMRAVRPATLQAFADRVATLPLIAEPGTRWSYSVGLDVMGAVIEKVSGVPFDRFVQARIFRPLGMTSSYWTVPAGDVARLADAYAAVGAARVAVDPAATSVFLRPPSFPYGGAGLVMSARDYDVFLHCLQDGGSLRGARLLRPETAALMMSNLLPAGVVFGGTMTGTMGTGSGNAGPHGYGAGGSVWTEAGPGGHPGKGTYGWGGAAGTIAYVDPANRTRGTIMLNLAGGIPGLAGTVRDTLVADGARLRAAGAMPTAVH